MANPKALSRTARLLILLCLSASSAIGQLPSHSSKVLHDQFQDRAIEHVGRLSSMGIRSAGSSRERRAARYISQQMKQAGLIVKNEPFTCRSFSLTDARLSTGNGSAPIALLGFNPYEIISPIRGQLVFMSATDQQSILIADLDNKIVVL